MLSMNQVGKRARERRKALGLRQHDLAERVGCNYPYISDFERGLVLNPKMRTLESIAAALEWSVAELLGETNGRKERLNSVA